MEYHRSLVEHLVVRSGNAFEALAKPQVSCSEITSLLHEYSECGL